MRKLLVIALVLVLAASPALAVTFYYPSISATNTRGVVKTILSAVTTGTSTVIVTDYKVPTQTIILYWNGTCSGGSVVIEAASVDSLSDTWAPLATVAAHSDIQDIITIVVPTHSVRARLASDVTGGGKLTVYYVGTSF